MINKAKQLNQEIKNQNISKEYFLIKEEIEKNEYINELIQVIKNTQLEMKNYLKDGNIKEYNASKQTLEILKEEFYKHPLINNYIVIKDEMYALLKEVVDILSE